MKYSEIAGNDAIHKKYCSSCNYSINESHDYGDNYTCNDLCNHTCGHSNSTYEAVAWPDYSAHIYSCPHCKDSERNICPGCDDIGNWSLTHDAQSYCGSFYCDQCNTTWYYDHDFTGPFFPNGTHHPLYNSCTQCGVRNNTGGGTDPCLIEGTLITMADGTQKPIEEVKKGELILSYDPNTATQTSAIVIDAYVTG